MQANRKKKTKEIISIKPNSVDKEVKETKKGLSKTLLFEIFGQHDFVDEFDLQRKKLKAYKCKDHITVYERIVAQIEIKLTIKKDTLERSVKENEILAVTDCDGNKQEHIKRNDHIIRILKYIKLVQRELKL